MGYELGFPIIDGTCQIDCHGWNAPLTLNQYYHLVDHHVSRKNLCGDDLRAFYAYAETNNKILNSTYMQVGTGYNTTNVPYGGTGVPGMEMNINGSNTSPEFVVDETTTITLPSELIESYIVGELKLAGYRPDSTSIEPIVVTVYDSDNNVIGYDSDYILGDSITVTTCIAVPEWSYNLSDEVVAASSTGHLQIEGTPDITYTWTISGIGFSLLHSETSGDDALVNTVITDETACGSAAITVTSESGSYVIGYVRSPVGQWVLIAANIEAQGYVTGAHDSYTVASSTWYFEKTLGQYIGWFKRMSTNEYIRNVKNNNWRAL